MLTFLALLDRAVPMLWRATWQAAILIAVILVMRAVLAARLSPGWRFALWGLVLMRLLAPAIPAGPLSLFRLAASMDPTRQGVGDRSERPPSSFFQSPGRVRAEVSRPTVDRDSSSVRPPLDEVSAGDRGSARLTPAPAPSPRTPVRIAGLIWLVGVLLLSGRTARAAVWLRRRSRDWSVVEDPSLLDLFDACRRTMGVRRPVRLRLTASRLGPAVTGLWRPCVLVPREMLASASPADLEHILLHELAHIRRWDVAVQWPLTAASILHWFNPAVWFAASRMQADRELACDADVLRRLGRDRRAAYGTTVLNLAAGLDFPRPRTALVGVFGTRRHLQERIIMIARYRPIGRGWGWLAAGLLLGLAVTGLTDAANPGPVEGPSAATVASMEQAGDEPGKAAEAVPKPIADAIAVLRKTPIRDVSVWGSAIRDLARIGKPAVPYLVAELDRTNSDPPMRALAFALRAIGDPRAVPGLIRALARSKLVTESDGDYGFPVWNAQLLMFLQKHDVDPKTQLFTVASGTAFHEVIGALHRLTGQEFHESELHFVDCEGSAKQRWLQRGVMHDLAARWAVWWKQSWRRFTDDPAYGKVTLPPLPEAPLVAQVSADQPFPMGNRVRATGGWSNTVVGPPQALDYYRTFKDLDTGREGPWPKELADVSKVKDEEVAAFAAREGYDLRGTEYTDPESGRSYYVIQALGLRAWQIDDRRWDTIAEDLRRGEAPKLDRPARELLMHVDPKTGAYRPGVMATFLLVTREGGTFVLQLNGLVTRPHGPEDSGRRARDLLMPLPPGEPNKPAPLRSIPGAYRGAQYQYRFIYAGDAEGR